MSYRKCRISSAIFNLMNQEVIRFTSEEGVRFSDISNFPGRPVFVKDIVLGTKILNVWNHVVWGRVKALKGLDCHSFITEVGFRYDAVNDFNVY